MRFCEGRRSLPAVSRPTNSSGKQYPAALNLLADAIRRFPDDSNSSAFAESRVRPLRTRDGEPALRVGLGRAAEEWARIVGGRASDLEAIDLLTAAGDYEGEAELAFVLGAARSGAAVEKERKCVSEASTVADAKARSDWKDALQAVDAALRRYPRNTELLSTNAALREESERADRRSLVERRRAEIRQLIDARDWARVDAALGIARALFAEPGDFDDLEAEAKAGKGAEYAGLPGWASLEEDVARQQEYEQILVEAGEYRDRGEVSKAEILLTVAMEKKRAGSPSDGDVRGDPAGQGRRARPANRRLGGHHRRPARPGEMSRAESELRAAQLQYPGHARWASVANRMATQSARRRGGAARGGARAVEGFAAATAS